jgi:hypothetical protein
LISEPCLRESAVLLDDRHPPELATADAHGNFVRTWGPRKDRQALGKLDAVLEWLGYKQDARVSDYWELIDVRSGTLLHRGTGELIAVSDDGRYIVSGDEEGRDIKIYELPLRRSLWFIAIAGRIWTVFAGTVRRWWRRRLWGEDNEAEKPHMHLCQAATAATP